MRRTMYILGILLTGIVGSILVWYLNCCPCKATPIATKNKDETTLTQGGPTSYPFSIKDKNGALNYQTQDNFNFHHHQDQIILPVSDGIDQGIDKLKSYLAGDDRKTLDIIGLYKSEEENNSPFPNLGISRANAAKNYLVAKGVDSKNINLKGKLDDELVANNNVYQGPVAYYLHTLTDAEFLKRNKELEAIHEHIIKDPLLLHFKFGSNEINFTNTQREKLQEIVTYIDNNHEATLDVIGHTDNVGDAIKNTALGLKRANFVKNYLIKIGISGDQIKSDSKGPNKPIATNKTDAGRAQNRRVELILE